MHLKTAITVGRPRGEVERRWAELAAQRPSITDAGATVAFRDAPGDRGTEIHIQLSDAVGDHRPGPLRALAGAMPLARAKDDLRRFKQLVETGTIQRSDAAPDGERVERKLRQRPAAPAAESELQEVGGR
jgi:hypothetical protein